MGNVFYFDWEIELIVLIQKHLMNSSLMNFLCVVFTYFGEPVLPVLLVSYIYFSYDKKFGTYLAMNVLTSCVANTMLKNIFFRIRPYIARKEISCLKVVDAEADLYDIEGQGYSFPSGHSMNVANYCSSLYLYLRKKILFVIGIILTLLVCFSRVALGVHYPTDVIVGAASGLLISILFNYLYKKVNSRKLLIIISLIFGFGFLYCRSNDYFQCYGILLGFCLGSIYEEKNVRFEKPSNKLAIVLRPILGSLLFFGLTKIIKFITPDFIVNNDGYIAFLFQFVRYFISSFSLFSFYPLLFKNKILK